MSEPHAPTTGPAAGRSAEQELQQAIAQIEAALEQPTRQLQREVDLAEDAVVRVRDRLIEQLRAEPEAERAPARRAALEQVNQAISLLAGVEYPIAAVYRRLLEEARDCLRHLLETGRLA